MEVIFFIILCYVVYLMTRGRSTNDQTRKNLPGEKEVFSRNSEIYVVEAEWSKGVEARPSKKLQSKTATWYGIDQEVNIQGYDIKHSLIYMGEFLPDASGYTNDASLINPKLPVLSSNPKESIEELGYWPNYSRISAKCRGRYLAWLAGGRLDPNIDIGYVFLFFYGLERRLFVDARKSEIPASEREVIVREVRRLLEIYGTNYSFRNYATSFLTMTWILYESDKPIPDYLDLNDRYYTQAFQFILARCVADGRPVPADIALQWVIVHPESALRTPARRCSKELKDLFEQRYGQKYGEGIKITPNKTPLRFSYQAASPSLSRNLDIPLPKLPDPFILSRPLSQVKKLVEGCIDELDPYSRYLGRKNNNPDSLAGLALLPKDLLLQRTHIKNLREDLVQVCDDGIGFIPVSMLYDRLGEALPFPLGKKEAESLAVLLEKMGLGGAPDIRYHYMKPDSSGSIAIFATPHSSSFCPSKEYCMLGAILRLGAMVSQIDQDISPSEEATLQKLVQHSSQLKKTEKNSLLAFLHWCLRTPQDATGLKQKLAEISITEKIAISHILISVAYADGRIDPQEVKQLEKLYTVLGLDKNQVVSDIHTLTAQSGPVTVSYSDKETAFTIPKSTKEPTVLKGFRLDEELIHIREEETRQVKGVLEAIFTEEVENESDGKITPASFDLNPLHGLDNVHQRFFRQLCTQESWERSVLQTMCKELGLMTDGALEVLNEWTFENVKAPLIDDGDPVYVDVNLAMEILND